ncbi:MAG: polyprenyl diphosphate synthase [Steroidobacteraceae bacterium]
MHVAIIIDGNGRWAAQRGLPRTAGHAQGARAVRRVVEAAARSAVSTLTLYAFSSDNWGRPAGEVDALLELFRRYLRSETRRCATNQVRLNVIGRRDRLGPELVRAIEESERLTTEGSRLHLRIAVDYSARHSIVEAARRAPPDTDAPESAFLASMNEVNHSLLPTREVDLLIRTGGEKRLSDFLLWECAYAELYFTDCLWPDFDEQGLGHALSDFGRRQRRFGKVPQAANAADAESVPCVAGAAQAAF